MRLDENGLSSMWLDENGMSFGLQVGMVCRLGYRLEWFDEVGLISFCKDGGLISFCKDGRKGWFF